MVLLRSVWVVWGGRKEAEDLRQSKTQPVLGLFVCPSPASRGGVGEPQDRSLKRDL